MTRNSTARDRSQSPLPLLLLLPPAPPPASMPPRRSSSRACDSDDDDDDSYATAALVQSPMLRLIGAGLAVAFRPVRELFFLLSWLIWLFSSVMLNTGQRHRDSTLSSALTMRCGCVVDEPRLRRRTAAPSPSASLDSPTDDVMLLVRLLLVLMLPPQATYRSFCTAPSASPSRWDCT
jgi:hypothetical protein